MHIMFKPTAGPRTNAVQTRLELFYIRRTVFHLLKTIILDIKISLKLNVKQFWQNKIYLGISDHVMVDMTDFLAQPNDMATKNAIIV